MSQGKENYTAEKVNASDLNQISKNANDGGGFRDSINAGETISALRPVFMDDTANAWKYADANDTARLRFDGLSLEAGSNGNPMKVQLEGIVRGLSSLDIGKYYYVQDDGTLGTSKGTYEILVGVAISATEILIKHEKLTYKEIEPPAWTSPSSTGSWEDWDLSAAIPAGAKYAEVVINYRIDNSGGNTTMGVRKNGSSINRYIYPSQLGGYSSASTVTMTVEIDVNRIIERYQDCAGNHAQFTIIGYWI